MGSELKRQFIKEFNELMGAIYTKGIAPHRSQIHNSFRSRVELKNYLESDTEGFGFFDAANFDYMLCSHYLNLYEMKNTFLGFSFRFADEFSDYAELKQYTVIECELTFKHPSEGEAKCARAFFTIDELKAQYDKLCQFMGMLDEYNIIKKNSPRSVWEDALHFCIINKDDSDRFFTYLKYNEAQIKDVLTKRMKYANCRAETNKAKQAEKQAKKQTHPKVAENKKAIKALQEQIRALEAENRQIEETGSTSTSDYFNQAKERLELKAAYEEAFEKQCRSGLGYIIQFDELTNKVATNLFIA